MNLKKSLKGVNQFTISSNHFTYVLNNELFIDENLFGKIYSYIHRNGVLIYSVKELDVENIYQYYFDKKYSEIIFKNGGLGNRFIGENYISVSNRTTNNKDVFNFINKKTIYSGKKSANSLVNNNLYFRTDTILSSLSLLTGEYEWEVDLSEYGEIRSVLAAVQDNLWVLANDYKNNRHSLLHLDSNSGRVMQVLGEGLKLSDAHVQYIEEKQTLLSFKSSISSVPSPSTLIEIDAKTGEILRNVTVESMLEPNLKVGMWQYQDNQLFFTANTTMMTTTHIGVLDYNTLELLWYTEVPDRKGLLKDIQVSSDKIYVLDQVGTLHIFEKESD